MDENDISVRSNRRQNTASLCLGRRIHFVWKKCKERMYLLAYSSRKRVHIEPYNPQGRIIAEQIETAIREVVPELVIHLIGSVSMGIAGRRDIDIFIECSPDAFESRTDALTKRFGPLMRRKKEYREWQWNQEGWEIDILLIDPTSEKFMDQVGAVWVIKRDPKLIAEYEHLKLSLDGASYRDYERAKHDFLNMTVRPLQYGDAKTRKAFALYLEQKADSALSHTTHPLSVTIGIPAYNEERNIGSLLHALKAQKRQSFVVDEIIVISDGSSDRTAARVLAQPDVRLINDGKRKGKSMRMNEIFALAHSDIVIIVDADIAVIDDALEKMVRPFYLDPRIMLVSGILTPEQPKTFAGVMGLAAYVLWETAIRMTKRAEMYRCGGPLRAFRKEFYKAFSFPPISADDVYPYLVCKKMHYQFSYIHQPLGSYKLPATYADLKKQQKRFLQSEHVHEQCFGADFIKQNYTVTVWTRVKAFVMTLQRFPVATLGYLFLWFTIKCDMRGLKNERCSGVWEAIVSTK